MKSSETGKAATGEEVGSGVLDQDIALIRRNTLAVRSNNLSNVFMANITQISESVNTFQKMSEESSTNDIVSNYNNAKENYEKEIEKLN